MRRALPSAFLSAALTVVATANLNAQNDRFAYAITDVTKEGAGWNSLRKLDLTTGQYSDVLVNGTDATLAVYDAGSSTNVPNCSIFGFLPVEKRMKEVPSLLMA